MIGRREFCLSLAGAASASASADRRIAITIDDLPAARQSFVPRDLEDFRSFRKLNRTLLKALSKRRAPITGFVTEGWRPKSWTPAQFRDLLDDWLDSGADLGNHTYSHPDLHTAGMKRFQADVVLGEPIVGTALTRRGKNLRYFRHPFLHIGKAPEERHELNGFLSERGYQVAPVTVDTQDWLFAQVYGWALSRRDELKAQATRETYLQYVSAVVEDAREAAYETLGREPAQVLLLDANALNCAVVDEALDLLAAQGYSFVSVEEALEDPVYREDVLALGSWVNGWRQTRGLQPRPAPLPETFLGSLLDDYNMVRRQYPDLDIKRTARTADV